MNIKDFFKEDNRLTDAKEARKKTIETIKSDNLLIELIEELDITDDEIIEYLPDIIEFRNFAQNRKHYPYIYIATRDDGKLNLLNKTVNKRFLRQIRLNENLWFTDITNINRNITLRQLVASNESTKALKTYISSLPNLIKNNKQVNNIYVYGKSGSGKSFISMCLAVYCSVHNVSSAYVKANQLQAALNAKDKLLSADMINKLKIVKVLNIDDIGMERKSPYFLLDVIYDIIEHRKNNNLPTNIFSPFPLEQLFEMYQKHKYFEGEKTRLQIFRDILKTKSKIYSLDE
ncbi:P-loop NTPase family protein [Mycoplasmopsis opalescens]|uniref:ATP-binding protein n=1 Tax=Mycoplasmopsis opalescens TaxID=114886 RepID=UPI0004A717B7|nr:ATP-binding protein [Mycoplasmopsis opalescens]